jgi:hypothetical protein
MAEIDPNKVKTVFIQNITEDKSGEAYPRRDFHGYEADGTQHDATAFMNKKGVLIEQGKWYTGFFDSSNVKPGWKKKFIVFGEHKEQAQTPPQAEQPPAPTPAPPQPTLPQPPHVGTSTATRQPEPSTDPMDTRIRMQSIHEANELFRGLTREVQPDELIDAARLIFAYIKNG